MTKRIMAVLLGLWLSVPLWAENAAYYVIDLAAGKDAIHYPVTRLDAPPAEGWTDEYKTTKLVLKRIEAGGDPCGYYTLTKAFYIGVFEVTQKQWELVMGSNPSSQKGDMRPVGGVSYNAIRGSNLGAKWPTTNAVDATSFLGKLRARTGLTLDLPTEAQWKYACRAGTGSYYNNGGYSEEELKQLGRYEGNVTDGKGGYEACTTVGSYEPNAWGLYDMHGNVWEWCLDWIREGEGPSFGAAEDPVGATSGAGRCQCGGSWDADMYKCAVQSEYSYFESPATRWPDDGLRLACPDEIPSVEPFAAYCVVDLAAGANANWYEVTMLDAAPEEGWTDEYKTTKLVLKRIEKGADPLGRYTVTKPFYIGVFEVTQKQWELVMGSNPSDFPGDTRPVECVSYQDIRGYAGEMDWPTTAAVDADSFVGRLRARTGLRVDLPTLGQSEYACRAGTRSNYNNGGNAEADLVQVGRYNGNRTDGKGGYEEHTTVGSYAPNAWGLYDMHGNVWEWCLDWGGADATGKSPLQANKFDGARCLHGGDWAGSWDDCGSSDWTFYDYGMQMGDANDNSRRYFGFRLASSARDPGVPWLRIMVGGEGTVTGSGAYEPGQSTTLRATAAKGYVFAGWYADAVYETPLQGSVDYRTTSFPYEMGAVDTTVYAKFVSSEEDKADGAISVDFPFGEIPEYGYVPGFPIEPLKVTVHSASLPTVTVSGLPAGLKWDSTTLTISGTPSTPGEYTVTVTAKSRSGAVDTVQQAIRVQPPFEVTAADTFGGTAGGVIGNPCRVLAYEAEAGILDQITAEAEGLPSGVTVGTEITESETDDETEVVQIFFAGTPSAAVEAKTYPVTVRVTYGESVVTKQYDFVVRKLPESLLGITLTAESDTVPVGGGEDETRLSGEAAWAKVELAFASGAGDEPQYTLRTATTFDYKAGDDAWAYDSDNYADWAERYVNSVYNPSTRMSGFHFVTDLTLDAPYTEAYTDVFLWENGKVDVYTGYYQESGICPFIWESGTLPGAVLPCVIPDNYPLPDKDSPATVLVSGVPADGLVAGEAYTLSVTVYDAAFPTVTATGLPTGMRWDANAMAIVGTPTVPGLYTAVFTVKSGAVAKTAAVDLKVKNFVSSYIGMADTYDGMIPGVAIEPIPFVVAASAPTAVPENAAVSVSGLPAGLKWVAASKTVEGTPTTPGAKTVTFTLTWTDAELGRMTEKATSTFIVGPFPALTVTMGPDAEAAGCKVSGSGAYAANKTVYLSATAAKGYVFAGWYDEGGQPLSGTVDYRTARFPYVTGAQDTTVYGRFVPSEEDRGIEMALADGGPFTPGVALADSLRLTVSSASLPNVTAKGLPPGLKWDAKSLQITGTPTTPGLYSVTFTATNATVKSPAVTYTADIAIANYVCDAISLTVPDCPILPGIPLSEQRDGAGNELTISVSAPNVTGLRVSGLPTGLSWDARTFRVDPSKAATKPGNYTVDVTGTYTDETGKRVTGRTTAVVTVAPLPVVTVAYNAPMGSVTGAGSYLPRTATVTLSARPATDCVFAGWYRFLEDGESVETIESAVEIEGRTAVPLKGTVDYRNPSFRFTAPDGSVSLFARFVLKREDTLPGIGLDRTAPVIDLVADTVFGSADMPVFDPAKSYEVSLRIASHSLPKVTVTGLPTGLYLDQNRLVLGGQPTSPGYYDMSIAVTNQSGYQASRRFRVRVLNRNTLFPDDWNPDDILLADVGANTEIALDERLVGATAAGVPPGMTWDAATGTLGGVPTYAGTYTVTFRKDGQTVTVTVTVSADSPYCVPISGEGEMTSWDQSRLVVLSGDVTYQPIFRIRPGSGFASAWPTVTVVGLPSGLKIEYETYETFGDASDCPFAPTFLGREEPGTCRDAFVSGTTRAAPGIYPVLISARNASGGQTECVVEVVVGSPTWPLSARYGTSDPASASQPDKPFAAVLEHTKKQLNVWSEGEAETRNFVASRGLEDDTFGDVDYEGWYSDKAWQDSYLIRLGIPGSDSLERCGFDGDTVPLAPAVDTSTMLYHPVPGWSRPVAAGSYRVSRLAYDWGAGMTYGDAGLLTVMQDGSVRASFGSGVIGTGWLLLTESASDAASDVARILLVLEDAYGYEEGVVVRPDINPGETVPSDMRWTSVDGPTPTL